MKLNFPPPDYGDDIPEEVRRLQQDMERVSEEVAMRAAKDVDDQITAAISMRVGHTDWKPVHMAGRLHRTIYADGSEVMAMDGVPLVHIGPWIIRQVGPSTRMTATRECTHLKGHADGKPN